MKGIRKRIGLAIICSLLVGLVPPADCGAKLPPDALESQEALASKEALMSQGALASPGAAVVPAESTVPVSTPTLAESAAPAFSARPDASAQPGMSAVPGHSATPGPSPKVPFVLKNRGAKLFKGGQKGISFGKVRDKKIYHINTFTSDSVKLNPSRKATFRVTGGSSKKEVRAGKVRVAADGTVTCREKGKGKKQYAIICVTAKDTGESIYVYLYFAPRLFQKGSQKMVIYQGKTSKLSFNYAGRRLQFTSSRPKVAKADKKGLVSVGRKGTAIITAKVRGSLKNQLKIRITVREEPWVVNDKDSVYSYEDMTSDLRGLAGKYKGRVSLTSIGTSEDGRNIWCLRIGRASASRKLVINAGIHAREWLNPLMLMRKSEEILRQYEDYRSALSGKCVYVIPMINPDGVTISQSGFGAIRSEKLRKLCQKTKSSYRTWKGNARAVNLNFNFPGGWNEKGKSQKPDGVTYPGEKPASEKETKAMMRFINGLSGLRGVINYHSTGSILYWNYNVESDGGLYGRQSALAGKIHSFTGYRLMPKSISTDPNGGMGDWIIYNKRIPNVTVETGTVMCPLPHSQLKRITRENGKMLEWFVKSYQ